MPSEIIQAVADKDASEIVEFTLNDCEESSFDDLMNYKSLISLSLANNKFQTLKNFTALPQLNKLDISYNSICGSIGHIVHSSVAPIRALNVTGNKIATIEELKSLASDTDLLIFIHGKEPRYSGEPAKDTGNPLFKPGNNYINNIEDSGTPLIKPATGIHNRDPGTPLVKPAAVTVCNTLFLLRLLLFSFLHPLFKLSQNDWPPERTRRATTPLSGETVDVTAVSPDGGTLACRVHQLSTIFSLKLQISNSLGLLPATFYLKTGTKLMLEHLTCGVYFHMGINRVEICYRLKGGMLPGGSPSATSTNSPSLATSATAFPTSAVQVKPAKFDDTEPAAWFAILEAQFHIARVYTSQTKFYHALSHLPTKTVSTLDPTIVSAADYDTLKKAVIDYHEATKPEVFEQFIRDHPLTGRPSHYLAEMIHMAAKVGVQDDFVRHRFTNALPSNIGPIIATQKQTPLADLGKLADELMAVVPGASNTSVAQVKHQNYKQNSGQNSNYNNKTNTKNSKGYSGNSRSLQPFSPNQAPKICRYHIYFGTRANKCRRWCQWPNKKNCELLPSATSSRASSPEPGENAQTL